MRYIVGIFWSVFISFVISYVLSSMSGEAFSVEGSLLLAAIFAVGIFVLGDGVLKEERE